MDKTREEFIAYAVKRWHIEIEYFQRTRWHSTLLSHYDDWQAAYRAGMERAAEICRHRVYADPCRPNYLKHGCEDCAAAIRKEMGK